MHDKQAIKMMQRCLAQLQEQRRVIENLTPKAEAWDTLRQVIELGRPHAGYASRPDLEHTLEKEISMLVSDGLVETNTADVTDHDGRGPG